MSISEFSEWLRCPNCFLDLAATGERTLGCANGHRFDLHRHGYATLLPPRAPAHRGDDRRMLVARDSVLRGGLYAPIVDAVVEATAAALRTADSDRPTNAAAMHESVPMHETVRVVDFGCGTGWYSGAFAERSERPVSVLMTDRSPAAVRWATLAVSTAAGVVLDVWQPLPLRDGSADVAFDIFAPRNPAEFGRVLRRGGILSIVVPRPGHLHELRALGPLLEVPDGKSASVHETFAPWFDVVETRPVTAVRRFTTAQAASVTAMGPSAHHGAAGAPTAADGGPDAASSAESAAELAAAGSDPTIDATLEVDVIVLRRR